VRVVRARAPSHVPVRIFVATVAVNMLNRLPSVRVTAKPLIGPLPNWKRSSDAARTVRFASKMALADRS
jgi:hypothetical protein